MGKKEGSTNFVLPIIVAWSRCSHDSTTAAMSTLVVVIVNKDNCMHTISHAPALVIYSTQAVKISTSDAFGQFDTITKLCNLSNSKVFLDSNRFSSHVNDLMEEQSLTPTLDIISASLNSLQVPGPHVFTSIYSEATDTNVDHVVEEVGNLAPDIVLATVQIIEGHQVAVTNFVNISVVIDFTVGLVEILVGKGDSVVAL